MRMFKVERSKYGGWGIGTRSRDDERQGYTYVRVPGWWLQLCWSPLRPLLKWRDLSKHVGHPGYKWLKPNKDGKYGYNEVLPREYSVSVSEGYVHLHHGVSTHDSDTDKSWCYAVPFLNWRFWRHSFYKLDGSLYAHSENNGFRAPYEKQRKLRDTVPKAYYEFKDYDGEVIKAACFIEEREWRYGTKWASFLSRFIKPRVESVVDLEFSSEVGPRKGSWKGGTIGHSCEFRKGERIQSAFVRYCYHNKLTFIGTCEPWKHEYKKQDADGANKTAQ